MIQFNMGLTTSDAIANRIIYVRNLGCNFVQAKLFNCLTGVFGPTKFTTTDRVSGPNFLDVGKFTQSGQLNGTLQNTFQVPAISSATSPPVKVEQNVCLLDPWG